MNTFDADVLAVDGALVVVTTTSDGHKRRRVHMTTSSAQRAVERAEQLGHTASIVLCRLMPVGVIE